jgi:SAM-dependent methyltransferase
MEESPDLEALRRRLEEEEKAYAAALARLDALAQRPPSVQRPELPELFERLNRLWPREPLPPPQGLRGKLRRWVWDVLGPALDRQRDFNAAATHALNAQLEQLGQLTVHVQELLAQLIGFLQRVLPVMDARDRTSAALATLRAELILESLDRRQESLARRVDGLLALRDRMETVSEEVKAVRSSLASAPPSAERAAAATAAAEDAAYVAFENRFRGSREEIRDRMSDYVELFRGHAPVVDLGCGRGEFLDLLKEAGIAARGVEANAPLVQEGRGRGLDVAQGDLLAFLREQGEGTLGGVFAAQVAEHLPPAALVELLRQAHRALRREGLLLLETVNPRSVIGLLEVFNRDLTHVKPLHPETLRFLAAAQGFSDVRIELRAPVDAASRLLRVPADSLPAQVVGPLNENVDRLNALLYGPQEYALFARR